LTQEYDYATHYIYDIHGNVKTLIQDNKYIHASQRYKRLDYQYDLISGRVNEVIYQPDAIDQYIHRYAYDPDNRITNVFTSKDGVIWEQDAKYFYYDHGPLARTEIGDRKVQGVDHAYTINGWLKGVNSNMLNATSDIGNDGKEADVNGLIAKDEFGYSLGYFQGDYTPRTAAELLPSNNFLLDHHYERSLYNGNITNMSTSIAAFMFGEGEEAEPSTFEYKYDQLNRIIEARHRDWTTANVPGLTDDRWLTSYNFDLNGNILNLDRHDSEGAQFDDLVYTYGNKLDLDAINNSGDLSMEENNRLMYVHDAAVNTINTDITGQDPFNYSYDNIGNLIADVAEEIENIEWTVTGKIKSITRTTESDLPDLAFLYDPMGQRIAKIVKDRTGGTPSDRSHWLTTWYVRDASGNVMSTYEEETEENSEAECPAGTYNYTTTIAWTEAHIYGSSRVGMEIQSAVTSRFGVNYDSNDQPTYAASNCISYAATAVYSQKYGDKRFELSNHLGNVLVVVSDLLIANSGTTLSYSSEVISATDYYPYGMVMDERNDVVNGAYRYGFNGQETQSEITNTASHMSAEFWMYDTRIGRRWNVDPRPNLSISVYACFQNSPVLFSDPFGDTIGGWANMFLSPNLSIGQDLLQKSETGMGIIAQFQEVSTGAFKPNSDGKFLDGALSAVNLRFATRTTGAAGSVSINYLNGKTVENASLSDIEVVVSFNTSILAGPDGNFNLEVAYAHEIGLHLNSVVSILKEFKSTGNNGKLATQLSGLSAANHRSIWSNDNNASGNATFNTIATEFGSTLDEEYSVRRGFQIGSGVSYDPKNPFGAMLNLMDWSAGLSTEGSRTLMPINLMNDVLIKDQLENYRIYSSNLARPFNFNYSYASGFIIALNTHKSNYNPSTAAGRLRIGMP
jgi:RHS repeat-associated protein